MTWGQQLSLSPPTTRLARATTAADEERIQQQLLRMARARLQESASAACTCDRSRPLNAALALVAARARLATLSFHPRTSCGYDELIALQNRTYFMSTPY